jgi:mannose-6-phosphate isomerase-like protein (cupin superfamily)
MRIIFCAIAAVLAITTDIIAQGSAAPPAIYKTAAEIAAALSKIDAARSSTATGADISIAPGVSVRRRSSGGEPQYAIIHPLSIEIYQITEGSGTLVTGGILAPPPPKPENPDVVRSTSIKGGDSRKVGKGDVVVMPPGTPHWFSQIDGSITYLEARIPVAK